MSDVRSFRNRLSIRRLRGRARLLAVATSLTFCAHQAHAFEFPAYDGDLKVRWDNTFKYSTLYRLKDPSSRIVSGDPNSTSPLAAPLAAQLDDGDRNFKKGVASNRVDWFSELDVIHKNMGFRVSAAAWYDDTYWRGNDNTSQATINSISVPAGQFTDATKKMMGRKAEILDAFVFLNQSDIGTPFTIRAGKHTILYGETLFFGANGIANAQAPMDIIKLLSVPSSQFKEIIRPVGQVSGQIQLTTKVSLGAYYQYEWTAHRLPASGSFLSNADMLGAGAETLFGLRRASSLKARDSGQGGGQIRFKPDGSDVEYALYAARYHDKAPQLYLDPLSGTYREIFPENIVTYGGSFSTVVGEVNVSGEASFRNNAPLVSQPQVDLGYAANNDSSPLYAVGKTAHMNLSATYLMGKTPIWDGATLLAEVGFNRTLSITKNRLALDPHVTRDAWGFRVILEPQYFQVVPSVDVTLPIGLGYNPSGRSSAVANFNGGVSKGGDFSIGVTADYRKQAKATLSLVHFFGTEDAVLEPNTFGGPNAFMFTGAQSLRDRDFLSFSIQTTF